MRSLLAISAASAIGISAASISAIRESNSRTSAPALGQRQDSDNEVSSLVVDLGYEQYQGVADSSTGLNLWLG